jgi:hypothetical protein
MFERIRTLLGEKTVQERVDLGREAAAWLGNPAADTALAHMRQVAMDSWLRCRDPRKRDEYWYEIHRIEAAVEGADPRNRADQGPGRPQ